MYNILEVRYVKVHPLFCSLLKNVVKEDLDLCNLKLPSGLDTIFNEFYAIPNMLEITKTNKLW